MIIKIEDRVQMSISSTMS